MPGVHADLLATIVPSLRSGLLGVGREGDVARWKLTLHNNHREPISPQQNRQRVLVMGSHSMREVTEVVQLSPKTCSSLDMALVLAHYSVVDFALLLRPHGCHMSQATPTTHRP